jgi:hypothetical protein
MKRLLMLMAQMVNIRERYLDVIKIKIDEHGVPIKTTIARSIDENTDDQVIRAFNLHEKRLLPAIKDGKPTATIIYLPVSGGERWEKMLEEMPAEWFLDYNNFLN